MSGKWSSFALGKSPDKPVYLYASNGYVDSQYYVLGSRHLDTEWREKNGDIPIGPWKENPHHTFNERNARMHS